MSGPPSAAQALAHLAEQLPIAQLDQLWIFPPRDLGDRESGLILASLAPHEDSDGDPGRRLLWTLRYDAPRGRRVAVSYMLEEQGSAPADRIPRVIGGVLRRTAESEPPREVHIGGDPERWASLVAELSAARVDHVSGE